MTPLDLNRRGLTYLATVFTLHPDGLQCAYIDACKLAARLIKAGLVHIRCPIAEAYPISLYGDIDPLDLSVWQPFCDITLRKSEILLVAKMKGWKESKGVQHEIAIFKNLARPIFYVNPETLEIGE